MWPWEEIGLEAQMHRPRSHKEWRWIIFGYSNYDLRIFRHVFSNSPPQNTFLRGCFFKILITWSRIASLRGALEPKNPQRKLRVFLILAVRAGFEPAVQFPVRQFSKLVVSASHPPHRVLFLSSWIRAAKIHENSATSQWTYTGMQKFMAPPRGFHLYIRKHTTLKLISMKEVVIVSAVRTPMGSFQDRKSVV